MRNVFFSIFVFFSVSMFADNRNVLQVELKDGTKNDYVLEDRPQIKYEGKTVVFYCKGLTTEYKKSDVNRFLFTSVETGIRELKAGDVRVNYAHNKLLLEGISKTNHISICSIDGKITLVPISYVGETVEISLSSLLTGYYIIHISNKQSIKVFKK